MSMWRGGSLPYHSPCRCRIPITGGLPKSPTRKPNKSTMSITISETGQPTPRCSPSVSQNSSMRSSCWWNHLKWDIELDSLMSRPMQQIFTLWFTNQTPMNLASHDLKSITSRIMIKSRRWIVCKLLVLETGEKSLWLTNPFSCNLTSIDSVYTLRIVNSNPIPKSKL